LHTLQKGGQLAASASLVLPLNENTVGYAVDSLSAWTNYHVSAYAIASTTGYNVSDMWQGYPVYNYGSSNGWLGADQSYIYVFAHHYDSEIQEWTDEYYIARISIDAYDGLELLRTETSDTAPFSSLKATQKGTIVQSITSGGITNRTMIDLSTMSEVYTDVLTNIPGNISIRENDAFIWIDGMGVYQKTPNGWLMYPTSEYPRNDDNQLLGYAIRNVKIGNEGLAIVLFE
jgi:hypothetical protein